MIYMHIHIDILVITKVIYQVILNSKGQSECDPYLSDAHCLKLVLIPPLFLSF